MEKNIDQVFKNLDDWRHLPSYQLERRADIFFSLYLKDVLEEKFADRLKGIPLFDLLVPEFPLRKGTYDAKNEKSNQSTKVDYLAVSKDHKHVFLVELKTDDASVGPNEEYLQNAKSTGFAKLLEGVLAIRNASLAHGKYDCLMELLERLELVKEEQSPDIPKRKSSRRSNFQVTLRSEKYEITVVMLTPNIIKVEQNQFAFENITFEDVQRTVSRYKDPLSIRFSESLMKWEKPAGTKQKL